MTLVQTELKSIKIGTTAIKRVTIYPDGVTEKQIRPAVNWDNLDVSTATLSKQFSTGYGFQGLYINPDENVALTASFGPNGTIRGYSFSNKDISTAQLNLGAGLSPEAHSVFANSTGTHIYSGKHGNAGGYANGGIYEYSTTDWNVGNMVSYKTFSPGNGIQTVWVNKAETYAICFGATGATNRYVYVYRMSTPGDISTATEVKSVSIGQNRHGLFFNDEMTKCVVCLYSASSGIVYQYDRDILNSNTYTQTHSFGPVGFTIGYANINDSGTTLYAARENGYIYQYSLT